jgi:hypothetical protein
MAQQGRPRGVNVNRVCSTPSCGKTAHARGFCTTCYANWRKSASQPTTRRSHLHDELSLPVRRPIEWLGSIEASMAHMNAS